MKVKIDNEKIFIYMALNNLTEIAIANKCQIEISQVKSLLRQPRRTISATTLIKFCQGTGLKFSNIFTIEESKSFENIYIDVLNDYYDDDSRIKIA